MTTDWTSTAPGLEPNVLNRRGSPLHYWVGGPQGGSAIAFLHGATMDHRMFNAQIPAVLGDHRVLAWDARGHGRSHPIGTDDLTIEDYVDDLVAVLDDAGIDQLVNDYADESARLGHVLDRTALRLRRDGWEAYERTAMLVYLTSCARDGRVGHAEFARDLAARLAVRVGARRRV